MDKSLVYKKKKEKKIKQKKIRRKILSISLHPKLHDYVEKNNIHLSNFVEQALLLFAKEDGHYLTLNTHVPVQSQIQISKPDDYDDDDDDGFDCDDPRAWE